MATRADNVEISRFYRRGQRYGTGNAGTALTARKAWRPAVGGAGDDTYVLGAGDRRLKLLAR
jgi:hypothetical protein